MAASILPSLWNIFSWIIKAVALVLQGLIGLLRLLTDVLERIFDYSFGWIL